MNPARRYGVVFDAEFREQFEAAPSAVRAGFFEVLGMLLAGPLPGQSALQVDHHVPWLADTYTVPVPGGGLLIYRVDAARPLITLLDLTWL